MKVCLSISGSDPTGGAGTHIDLRTFSTLGLYGVSAVTAVTAQNTRAVTAVHPVPQGMLRSQINKVVREFRIDAVKIGMLATKTNVQDVVEAIRAHSLKNVVLDTVLFSSSRKRLLDKGALPFFVEHLFPLATVITSNLNEAGVLAGIRVGDKASMKEAALRLHRHGPRVIVIKGGHLKGPPDDLIYDGRRVVWVTGVRVRGEFHGLGCVFSSAIAGFLALRYNVHESVTQAKKFLERSLKTSFAPPGGRKVITFL